MPILVSNSLNFSIYGEIDEEMKQASLEVAKILNLKKGTGLTHHLVRLNIAILMDGKIELEKFLREIP